MFLGALIEGFQLLADLGPIVKRARFATAGLAEGRAKAGVAREPGQLGGKINGGRRGYLLEMPPAVLIDKLHARPVQCAN